MSDVYFIKSALRDMVEDIRASVPEGEYLILLETIDNLTENSFGQEVVTLINIIGIHRERQKYGIPP